MKHTGTFGVLLLTGTLLLLLTAFTQKEDVVAALRAGSAEKMAKYFDNMVDVSVPGKSNTFSKGQAEMVLKDFFSLNRVKGFELEHSGSNPSANFIIGTLLTSGGTFRTTVYMCMKGDKLLVQGVEFDQK